MVREGGQGIGGSVQGSLACRCRSSSASFLRLAPCLFLAMLDCTSRVKAEGFGYELTDDLQVFTSASSAANASEILMISELTLSTSSSPRVEGDWALMEGALTKKEVGSNAWKEERAFAREDGVLKSR